MQKVLQGTRKDFNSIVRRHHARFAKASRIEMQSSVTDFKINGKAYVEEKEGGVLVLGASRKCRTHRVQAESKRWINNKVGFAKLTGKGGTRCFTRPERRVKELERES